MDSVGKLFDRCLDTKRGSSFNWSLEYKGQWKLSEYGLRAKCVGRR